MLFQVIIGVGFLAILIGVGLVGSSFVPNDTMVAIPLPKGRVRQLMRPVGVVVALIGIALPIFGSTLPQVQTPTPEPVLTDTSTPTDTPTAAPTIPLVPTATPIPPTPTITPTRGTQAPVQSARHSVGTG